MLLNNKVVSPLSFFIRPFIQVNDVDGQGYSGRSCEGFFQHGERRAAGQWSSVEATGLSGRRLRYELPRSSERLFETGQVDQSGAKDCGDGLGRQAVAELKGFSQLRGRGELVAG